MILIPILEKCWQTVSMYYITELPASEKYDTICLAVDELSNKPIFAPTYTTTDYEDTTELSDWLRSPTSWTTEGHYSDWDPKYAAHFWKSQMNIASVKLSMTSSYRAQSNE